MDPNQIPDGKPYEVGLTQNGRAIAVGSNVRLYLAFLNDRGMLVQIETEMLPSVALQIAQSLADSAARTVS